MWRRALYSISTRRPFSSSSSQPDQIPSLYSFLQPSLFSLPKTNQPNSQKNPIFNSITETQQSNIETSLQDFLSTNKTDEAWKSFKSLTSCSCCPSKHITNSLIAHLSSFHDTLNLKRAFASVVFVLEKNPSLLEYETVKTLLVSMNVANTGAPAFALVKAMFKNRFFMPFEMWGGVLVDLCRKNGSFAVFLGVFSESCKVFLDEKVECMRPDLAACNAVLEYYCREVESVSDVEKLVETMSVLGIRPDKSSFGLLAYLYAVKGLDKKVGELEDLLGRSGFSDKCDFVHNLVCGYVKSKDFQSVAATVLRGLQEVEVFSQETCNALVKGFIENENHKSLANLVVEAQKAEPSSVLVERSFGYGVICSCVDLGLLDKAHCILDEINAQGVSVGLGVYVPVFKAYCKRQKTAEAAQLVTEISSLGVRLDIDTYDSLIEASMSSQDFQSAFSIFRDMREARISELNRSYLTIMTGLTEHRRPELMAVFLDEAVEDPRIEICIHDWNSIIHAFCKVGRLEDAMRTFRRMTFLQFEPNQQTYLSLINGYIAAEKYFNILTLWNEVKQNIGIEGENKFKVDISLIDAFLSALVKGGFFDSVMEVVKKSQREKIYVDKWKYKQVFMEKHNKLNVPKMKRQRLRKTEALIAFKEWAGLNT